MPGFTSALHYRKEVMKLYIIRHGETSWNRERKLQGHHGSDLNAQGIEEAKKTARGLVDIPFTRCFTSPLIRAKHTAELIMEGRDVPIIEDDRLMEIGFGIWEGRDILDIPNSGDEENWNRFMQDPFHYEAPEGGELIDELLTRTGALFEELVSNPAFADETILISCHGCSCRAFLHSVYEDKNDFWHGGVPKNCAVNIVEVDSDGVRLIESDRLFY